MLLKCCQTEKKVKIVGNTQKRSTVSGMRFTNASQAVAPRVQRKAVRSIAVKRNRAVKEELTLDPVCDNSNDSGLGFEQHQEYNVALRLLEWPNDRLGLSHDPCWVSESPEVKRKRLEIKIESDDANDNFSFPDGVRHRSQVLLSSPTFPVVKPLTNPSGLKPGKRVTQCSDTTSHVFSLHKDGKLPKSRTPGASLLANQLLGQVKSRGKAVANMSSNQTTAVSRDGKTRLVILSQPEQQHRARYQTEGSRGAVKDRSGNGFPQVQLSGWVGPATLEVYIGSDCGKLEPHMFYQACRVSGKNSTQCQERTEEGTVVIEIPFEPSKDMTVTCDCVGILKERNVDVEHRFPDQSGPRNKKKSTRCRMVFRTFLTRPDGTQEMLQICSQPIACTQPPGIPEICKKSLTSSPAGGGLELFILGKNFLKDTRVLFSNPNLQPAWEVNVTPDKEYLQQSHLVCVVPPYQSVNITEAVTVRLTVTSSDKSSEAHYFTYTPQSTAGTCMVESRSTQVEHPEEHTVGEKESIFPMMLWRSAGRDGAKLMATRDLKVFTVPTVRKNLPAGKPAEGAPAPLLTRRVSPGDQNSEEGKRISPTTQINGIDLSVKSTSETRALVDPIVTGTDLQSPSIANLQHFIVNDNGSQLPSLSVENFLSRIEQKLQNPKKGQTDFLPDSNNKVCNAVSTPPECVQLDTMKTETVPPGGPTQMLSNFQNLSDEQVQSTSVESSIGSNIKVCTGSPSHGKHLLVQATSANIEQSEHVATMSGASLLQNVNQEQVKFLVQSSEINDVQERNQISPQDNTPNTVSGLLSANGSTSRQSTQLGQTSEISFTPKVKSAVGSDNVINQAPDVCLLSNYENRECGLTNNSINSKHETSFTTYILQAGHSDNLHSSLVKGKELTFKHPTVEVSATASKKCSNLLLNDCNQLSMSDLLVETGRSELSCSPPVARNGVSESSQNLPKVDNNHNSLILPTSVAHENTALTSQGSPSLGNRYLVSDVSSSSHCTPITVKNILNSNDSPMYNAYVQENASAMSVCQCLANESDTVIDDCSKCQITENANVSSVHGLADNNLLNMNAIKTESVFDVKEVITTAQSLVSNEHITMCSTTLAPMYNFTNENVITSASHTSLPEGCVSSPSPLQLGNNQQCLTIGKKLQSTSLPSSVGGKDYAITITQNDMLNGRTEPTVSKPFTTCLSVDNRVMGPDLNQDLHNSIVSNSLCSPTMNRIVGNSTHGPVLDSTLLSSPMSMDNGADVENIPTSVNMSNVLLHSAVTLNNNNPCSSSIAMKELILSAGMLSNKKTASDSHMPVEPSISDTSPALHPYRKVCPETSAPGIVKDVLLSSPGHDQLISQAQAVSPEAVGLEALMSSTLDNHIQSTQTAAGLSQHSKIEVPGARTDQTTHSFSRAVSSNCSSTNLIDNMFSLNSDGKTSHMQCFVAGTMHSDITRVRGSSQCSQMNSSIIAPTDTNCAGYESVQATTNSNSDFATIPGNAQFGIVPVLSFSSPSGTLPFSSVPSSSSVMNQLINLEAHQAKVEEKAKLITSERREEGMLSQELTQMSEHDLISYINPSCFDQV